MVQQEEAREVELLDDPQLLLQPRGGGGEPVPRVAVVQPHVAQLRQPALHPGVLGAGVAVAEVAAQIEPQALGQPRGLGDGLRVIGKASRHRSGRGEHVAEVATALRL